MTSESDEIPLDDDCVLYKINGDYTGFYRVNYDKEDLRLLGQMVQNKSLQPIDRWSIEYDLYAFLRSNQVDLETFLDFAGNYNDEDNHLAIRSISNHLSTIPHRPSKRRKR